MKMGSNFGGTESSGNNKQFESKNTYNVGSNNYNLGNNNYGMNNNTNSNGNANNANYRKPFKPNFEEEQSYGNNKSSSVTRTKVNTITKGNLIINFLVAAKKSNYHEVEDDRPAFNQKGGVEYIF